MYVAYGLIGVLALAQTAWADRKQEIETHLRRFQQNPAQVMNERLQKKDGFGRVVKNPETPFSQDDIRSRDFVTQRDTYRQRMCKEVGGARVCLKDIEPGRAPIQGNDLVEDLVDNGDRALRSLEDMEKRRLRAAKLAETPWSDDYWAIYKGVLAARYADDAFPADEDWKKNNDYVTDPTRSFQSIFSSRLASSIDTLSPAEKYDLLVGDKAGTLTHAMWEEGEEYYKRYGKVERWMGVCHGWAPGAYMLPRPTDAVTVTAADGKTRIRFYPSDIKALGTLLWAKAEAPTKFSGGRCDIKEPKQDSNGRVTAQECFDNNPGTWHMTVVNQIGVAKRSFVIDATFDYEVWNQPVYSYEYTYFNPQTNEETASLAKAKVELSKFRGDKFRKYRSPEARYVVGVAMDVTYVVETQPTHELKDSPERDATRSARYMYDLELDAQGNIVGGEWYTNLHPDFLWTPPVGARAVTSADRFATGNWDGKSAMPAAWSSAAKRAAQYGQPLAKVVEALFTLARIGR
jgi:hypothetical protein